MARGRKIVGIVGALLLCASVAMAWPLVVEHVDGPQDPLVVPGRVHELGLNPPFPVDEWILSRWEGDTSETSCFDGNDNPMIPNQLVSITNMTNVDWEALWYVADPETSITNFDGWVGNAGLGDSCQAFRIDSVGINRPLIYESILFDGVFQVGETWTFILQDWQNPLALPPASAAFDSLGIASISAGFPPSTGSIIAVPEPSSALLLIVGAGALMMRRKKTR